MANFCDLTGHYAVVEHGRCLCGNCRRPLTIVVNHGDVFFGTAEQWRDCFFDNATIGNIISWCMDNNFTLGFELEKRAS